MTDRTINFLISSNVQYVHLAEIINGDDKCSTVTVSLMHRWLDQLV